MSSTPLTCSSSGAATDSSTVVALAPRKAVETLTSGGVMSGNFSTGRIR